MKPPITAALLGTLSLLLAPPASSRDEPQTKAEADYQTRLFEHLDIDSNGKLTRREFVVAALYDVYVKQDTDKDGRLTKEEFIDTFKEETDAEAEWAMMDTDGDGLIIFRDVFRNKNAVSEMEAEFATIDTLKRGYVTLEQLRREDA